jgi:hypothetical protein
LNYSTVIANERDVAADVCHDIPGKRHATRQTLEGVVLRVLIGSLRILVVHIHTDIHTTHALSPKGQQRHLKYVGVSEERDTHVLPKLVNYEEHCIRDRW